MLNFVLCDDNLVVLERLSKILESIFIKNNIDAQIGLKCSTANEVLEYVNQNKVDVLILDINLKSDINGCDIADEIRKKNKQIYIIFLTGHLEYALLAYKYKTFDYLPKPIVDERLEDTILRLIDDMQSSPNMYIKLSEKLFVKQDEINYIKKDGMKLVFCTKHTNYEIYSSFNKFESCLPDNFIRCHKSFIVNINNVNNLKFNDNVIVFGKDEQCTIGAKYKNNFLEVLKNGNNTNNLECINH